MSYWTFEQTNGDWFDGEFDTLEKAEEYADNLFAERCEDGGLHTCEINSKLVNFSYDDENEMVIHQIIPFVLSYERERMYG